MTDEKRSMTIDDLYRIAYVEDPQVSPDGQWVAYVKRTLDRIENGYKTNIFAVPTTGGEPIQLTRSGKDSAPRWSPDGSALAFVSARDKKPQVYILKVGAMGGEARALTKMPTGAMGARWSPDGQHIAFTCRLNAEERQKEDSDEEETPPQDQLEGKHRKERKEHDEKMRFEPRPMHRIPYRAGTNFLDDRASQIYVVDAHNPEAKPRRLTDFDDDYAPPVWAPGGEYLYSTRPVEAGHDQPWRYSVVVRIKVEDGSEEVLTSNEDFTAFNPWPSPDGQWVSFVYTDKNATDDLLWLGVLPAAGGDMIEVTREFDRAVAAVDWAPEQGRIILALGDQGDTELYQTDVGDSPIEKIAEGRMEIQGLSTGPTGTAYVATTPTTSTDLYWFSEGEVTQLTEVNRDFLDEVIVQETHELRYEAPDGTPIQGWYILPVGYEEGETYPLALNIHGGPHVMWGPSAKTMFHEWQAHAAAGYVVFYCNPRGSEGYGVEFNSAIHGKWGDIAMPDVIAGVDALIEMGIVDEERMAITGGSYGGYLTAWIIAHTDRFACAVPQRGVYNIASFYGTSDVPMLMSSEFDGDPWEPGAFERMWQYSPLAHAHRVETPTLIVHAENDYRVPIEQAEQFYAYMRRSGGIVEMWRYPRDGHELSRSGEPRNRVKRLEKMVEWFDRYCK